MKPDLTVYHYSYTARLPEILVAGELRPTLYDNGITDFLWATISTRPDPTARPMRPSWFGGHSRLVRFVLPSKGFMRFDAQAISRHWGPEYLWVLESDIRDCGRSLVESWRVRIGPLPLTKVVRIEIRRSVRGRWDPFIPGVTDHMIEAEIDDMIADARYREKDEEEEAA